VTWLGLMRLTICCLLGVFTMPLTAQEPSVVEEPGELKVIQVREPDGQILSYGDLSRPTEVWMGGTSLAREARIKLRIQGASGSSPLLPFLRKRRPGFVEIDINHGNITGRQPAHQFGKDFLTYVLWAVSGDGKASNLGEITSWGQQPITINARTPYQAFWLMVTAEPDFAVVDPSPQVVLYSVDEDVRKERTGEKVPPQKTNLFFSTHYTDYDSAPTALVAAPNELLQARKAVELASRSGILGLERSSGAREIEEEKHTRENLTRAKSFLVQAESAYKKKPPNSNNGVQSARTAAQIAENARALALGALGGNLIRQLEDELARFRAELAETRAALSKADARLSEDPKTSSTQAPGRQAETVHLAEPSPTSRTSRLVRIVSSPGVWFGLIGWGLATLLLLRRQPA